MSQYKTLKKIAAVIGLLMLAFPLTSFSAPSKAQCIHHQNQLSEAPDLAALVERAGGIERFQGVWHFGGGPFGIGKTTVVFQARPEGLVGRVDDSKFARIEVCTSPEFPGALEIRVPVDGKIQVAVVKPGRPGEIQIAAQKSNWQFYTFGRLAPSSTNIARNVSSVSEQEAFR
jgi:hypothetical protein